MGRALEGRRRALHTPLHKQCLTEWLPTPALQIRDIELALTNRRAVTYSARIDGPACFSVDPAVLRVDPGRPCSVSVKFSPGTSKPQFGRLVLMNKREVAGMPAAGEGGGGGGKGGAQKDAGGGGKDAGLSTALAPAIMVFQLAGAVLTQQPLKRVDVMTPLYELTTFDISVTNPYPVGECSGSG
jgi:hypothetical protein